jgi:hypothetical protein
MASPPIPPSLLQLAERPFSFYPAILNVEHNEWLFRKTTWQELVVVNSKSGAEMSIPRRFLGEVSCTGAPVLIVGLNRELQYKNGAICPYQRRVIEMPVAVGERPSLRSGAPRQGSPAPVVSIRLDGHPRKRVFKIVGGALAVSIFLYVASAGLMRVGEPRQRAAALRRHGYVSLAAGDQYSDVVRKLGPPVSDRCFEADGAMYRTLRYQWFTAVLRGGQGAAPSYIGCLDEHGYPVAGDARELETLRRMKRF